MVRAISLFIIGLSLGCPEPSPVGDAGPVTPDIGAPTDAGPVDADQGRPTGTCDDPSDCVPGEQCSSLGRCYTGDCYGHPDCAADERCSQNRCLPRPSSEHGIVFERRFPEPGLHHYSRFPTSFSDGFGGALLDADGDGDLDLFLGSHYPLPLGPDDRPACLYTNESTPSELVLEPVLDHCQPGSGYRFGGQGVDLDGDGRHELLIMGNRTLLLQRFFPESRLIDILAMVPDEDRRSGCNVATALPIDLDWDGRLDLYVACQATTRSGGHQGHLWMENIPMRQEEDGRFRLMEGYPWDDLVNGGNTLALGALDLDDNGIIDIVLANDSFTTLALPELLSDSPPGLALLHAGPGAGLPFPLRFFGQGNGQSGSYMGVASLIVEGLGEHLFLSDFGPNRLVTWDQDQQPIDRRVEWGVDLPGNVDEQLLFTWGALADDFDRDGRDDLFLAQGIEIAPGSESMGEEHYDLVFLQREGRFDAFTDEVGISRHDRLDSGDERRFYSSRGAVKADLDSDGFLELISGAFEGRPRFHSEVPLPDQTPRCTLKPVDRYVPTFGIGHAYRASDDSPWRRWDVGGQLYFGTSPWPVVPWQQGDFRFASGRTVPYDCAGTTGPVELVEPDWIRIDQGQLNLDLQWRQDPVETVRLAYRSSQGIRIQDQAGASRLALATEPGDDALMIALDNRWIARWFELP